MAQWFSLIEGVYHRAGTLSLMLDCKGHAGKLVEFWCS